MSGQELFELARRRIDKRSRGLILWSIDLMVLIMTLAAMIILGDTSAAQWSAAVFFG